MSNRKYIGVDLGAWYNKDNKTSIAVGVEVISGNEKKLRILKIVKEYTKGYTKKINDNREYVCNSIEVKKLLNDNGKKILNKDNWNLYLTWQEKNKYLIDYVIDEAANNALISIDAPFSIPALLKNVQEEYYELKECYKDKETEKEEALMHRLQLQNPYLFDNSARFIYEHTCLQVLAPSATLIGALSSRMAHIIDLDRNKAKNLNSKMLNICVSPKLDERECGVNTIEVYPAATLAILSLKYSKYKDDNWNNEEATMLTQIEKYVDITEKVKGQIKTDDDYDAIICALTAYLVDKKDGYLKPDNKGDLDKFTNSFIYIPKID